MMRVPEARLKWICDVCGEGSAVPTGRNLRGCLPSDKSLGYYQAPLRGADLIRKRLPDRVARQHFNECP